jgi:hypothetical protein
MQGSLALYGVTYTIHQFHTLGMNLDTALLTDPTT